MNAEVIETDIHTLPAAAAPQHQLTAVEHAIGAGATPEQLERVLELQVRADNHKLEMMREKRRMDEEDRKAAAARAFDSAMTKLRKHNVIIPKTKEVVQTARGGGPGPRFMQSEFDVVCSRLSPALYDCGLSFRHDMRFDIRPWKADGSNPAVPAGTEITIPWVYVTCYLTHSEGHTEALTLEGPPDTSGSKNPLQEMQSTASYLKRQSLLAITGTATGGEDDENRLRNRGQQGGTDDTGADVLDGLRTAGRDEALKGLKALTAWWGSLSGRQRTDLSPDFPGLRKAATVADQHGTTA
ncbi:MAG: hypothetical protein RJA55_2329 [Acidobacteriota bacterium]|jgi:hypothetical protein